MKVFPFIAIFDGFVHAPRQNTVSTSVFCCDATKQCKYQRFGLQHAKSIANSDVLLKLLCETSVSGITNYKVDINCHLFFAH